MAKKLYRSQKKLLTGVCAGVAEYFDIDPIIVRIAAVILAFVTGFFPMAIIYVVASILIGNVPLDEDQNLRRANIDDEAATFESKASATSEQKSDIKKPSAEPSSDDEFNAHFENNSR